MFISLSAMSPGLRSKCCGMAQIESAIHSITSGNRAADLFPLFCGWILVAAAVLCVPALAEVPDTRSIRKR
jgi:hypothetical protein